MTSSIDQQFIEFIVKSLVGNPDAVSIARTIDEKGVLLELTVDQEDLGRVIGKRGATAQSLRTLLRALGTKNDARYNLKIVDVGPPQERGERPDNYERQERPAQTEKSETREDSYSSNDQQEVEKQAPAEVVEEKVTSNDDGPSDALSRTRAELDELDDLDI